MKRYRQGGAGIIGPCPGCGGAITTFSVKNPQNNSNFGEAIKNDAVTLEGVTYGRTFWKFMSCVNCQMGAVAKIHVEGGSQRNETALVDFYPRAVTQAKLPAQVPTGIVNEFREAERDAGNGEYRSATGLIRSVLDKTLLANGYATPPAGKTFKPRLVDQINLAADDGIITQARRQRAHEDIRVLGNEILHDEWRLVTEDEYELAHDYCLRILEDFYENRTIVLKVLYAKGRVTPPGAAAAGGSNVP